MTTFFWKSLNPQTFLLPRTKGCRLASNLGKGAEHPCWPGLTTDFLCCRLTSPHEAFAYWKAETGCGDLKKPSICWGWVGFVLALGEEEGLGALTPLFCDSAAAMNGFTGPVWGLAEKPSSILQQVPHRNKPFLMFCCQGPWIAQSPYWEGWVHSESTHSCRYFKF